jgi:hypothetical protein
MEGSVIRGPFACDHAQVKLPVWSTTVGPHSE